MTTREFHLMTTEVLQDTRTVRYRCSTCGRCVEDGPEGITIVHKGDLTATHRGGVLAASVVDVDQHVQRGPALH